jgi:hypothetical protein
MIKHPSCSSCQDGEITVTIEGPRKNYQFRIEGPGITNPEIWYPTDNFGGRSKTFKNLGVGIYTIEVDLDDSFCTQNCVKTYLVELLDPCPAPENPNCICENALYMKDYSESRSNSMPEQAVLVRFLNRNPKTNISPFSPYISGTKGYTAEFWLKLPRKGRFQGESLVVFSKNNNLPNAVHWTEIVSPNNYQLYTNLRIQWREDLDQYAPEKGWYFLVSNAVSNNKITSPTPTVPIAPGTHSQTRIRYSTPLPFNELFHVAFVVRDFSLTNPTSNDIKTGWELYVNGLLIPTPVYTATGADTVMTTFSQQQLDFINKFKNHLGPILIGGLNFNVGTDTAKAFPKTGEFIITNFKYYKRPLTSSEVQLSYLQGCRSEGFDCDDLVIWAPLNQTEGNVTIEKRFGNHGELINFKPEDLKPMGKSWVKECCGRISDTKIMDCPTNDCIPNAAMFRFKFTAANTNLAAIDNVQFVYEFYDVNKTPVPTQIAPGLELTSDNSIEFDKPAGANVDENIEKISEALVASINSLNPSNNPYSMIASYMNGIIEISMPFNPENGITEQTLCNKNINMNFALKDTNNLVTQINVLKFEFVDCDYTICCLPICNNESELEIKI